MPANSFDTFFACTILVAVVLVATAFSATTLQAHVDSTKDVNKISYLKAIADHIVTSPGVPATWGTASGAPSQFGLAKENSANAYELDLDKVSRLNNLNSRALSYGEIFLSAKLRNMALGVQMGQLMSVAVTQTSNQTIGSNTSFTFSVTTQTNSKPTSVNLHGYIIAQSYQQEVEAVSSGICQVTFSVPTAKINSALLVLFAKANFDERVTSYAVYSLSDSTQQVTPTSTTLGLTPNNYTLTFNDTAPEVHVSSVTVLSYSYQKLVTAIANSQCSIPRLLDNSPLVIVASGTQSSVFFLEWTSYPQVPLQTGANFGASEQNVFSYLVTVNGVFYKIEITLGAVHH